MLNYEDLRQDGLDRKLPVLYNIPRWEYIENTWRFIPSPSYTEQVTWWIKTRGRGQKGLYYLPETGKLCSPRKLTSELRRLNINEREWYNKHFLGILSLSSIYPYCIECKKNLLCWKGKISHGYTHLCSRSCNISRNNRENWKDPFYRENMTKFLSDRNKSGTCGFGSCTSHEMSIIQKKAHSEESKEKWRNSRYWYDSTGGYLGRLISGYYKDRKFPVHPRYKSGYYYSEKLNSKIHYRSGYEIKCYELLDEIDDILSYSVEPFGIKYYYKGKSKTYYPDILLNLKEDKKILVEIKPSFMVNDDKVVAKSLSALKYCSENGMKYKIITEHDIFDLLSFKRSIGLL